MTRVHKFTRKSWLLYEHGILEGRAKTYEQRAKNADRERHEIYTSRASAIREIIAAIGEMAK